jgi:hypothetical protein
MSITVAPALNRARYHDVVTGHHRPDSPMIRIRRLPVVAGLIAAALPLASCRGILDDTCVEVQGTFDPRAPGYIVGYEAGVPVQATTSALAAKYGFTPTYVWDTGAPGFAAPLTDAAVEGLRCESAVKRIEHDGVTGGG